MSLKIDSKDIYVEGYEMPRQTVELKFKKRQTVVNHFANHLSLGDNKQ